MVIWWWWCCCCCWLSCCCCCRCCCCCCCRCCCCCWLRCCCCCSCCCCWLRCWCCCCSCCCCCCCWLSCCCCWMCCCWSCCCWWCNSCCCLRFNCCCLLKDPYGPSIWESVVFSIFTFTIGWFLSAIVRGPRGLLNWLRLSQWCCCRSCCCCGVKFWSCCCCCGVKFWSSCGGNCLVSCDCGYVTMSCRIGHYHALKDIWATDYSLEQGYLYYYVYTQKNSYIIMPDNTNFRSHLFQTA